MSTEPSLSSPDFWKNWALFSSNHSQNHWGGGMGWRYGVEVTGECDGED